MISSGAGVVSVAAAVMMFPYLNTELAPQTDEGVVNLTNTSFNLQAYLGVIMLGGIVVSMLVLVPMALGPGEGSELQVPLAGVVIGGLLTSTFITRRFCSNRLHPLRGGMVGTLEETFRHTGSRTLNA